MTVEIIRRSTLFIFAVFVSSFLFQGRGAPPSAPAPETLPTRLAGPKAIRAVARYVEEHRSTVRVFYTSNVEQYLFQDAANWKRFYDNVAFLPTDSTSTFIRYVLNGWGFHERTSLTSPMDSTLRAYRYGRIQDYTDVVALSR